MAKDPKKEPHGRSKPKPGGYEEREGYGVQGYYGQERGGQWGQVPEGEQGFSNLGREVRGDYGSEGLEKRKRELAEKAARDDMTSAPKASDKTGADQNTRP